MQCPVRNVEHAEILLDYCSGKLRAESLVSFESHLAGCLECKEFCVRQKAAWTALDVWEAEPVSEKFDVALYARIEAFENRSWWRRFAWRRALSLGAACAAVAIALFVHAPVNRPKAPASVHETTRVETVEPEQLERTLEDLEMLKQLSPSNAQNL
jgi:anti-sigma factor RsiW